MYLVVLKFAHPDHFYLLTIVPLLLALWWSWFRWQQKALLRLGDTTSLLPRFSSKQFWLKNMLVMVGFALLAIVWANPQVGAKNQTTTQESSDVFILLDISQSMLCRDIAPSRLELSKIFIKKLVQKLEGERIGLIFFAGNAFLQMPLSSDYAFVFQSIQSASPDMLTAQGTDIAAAIEVAQRSFDPEPAGGRMLLVFSDGETHDDNTLEKAEDAFNDGTLICTVGVGTASGGTIPLSESGLDANKLDENNQVVITRLQDSVLDKIAAAGGGQAFNVSQGDAAIAALKNIVDGLQKRATAVRSLASMESWYQWFLLPAILLLLLELFVSYNVKIK